MGGLMIKAITISCAAISLLAAAGTAAAQTGDTIKIGMAVSSTGNFALAAQSGERGAKIWVDDVNRRGGIELGGKKYKIELIERDDRSDKTLEPRVYEGLINDDKVDVLFGPFGSTLTEAAITTTEREKKLLVIWSASAEGLYSQGYKYIVSATQQASSLLGLPGIKAMKAWGAKKLAIVYDDEPFPAGIAKGSAEWAKANGMAVTLYEKYAKGTKDFSILIQKAKASGADAFFPAAYEDDEMAFARQLRELNVDFDADYVVYGSQPQFLAVGKDADFLVSQTLLHDKINWQVTDGLSRAQMVERYKELFPTAQYAADFQTALAYGAGVILERMIKDAQSLDAEKLKAAALALDGKVTVMCGQYHIEPSGRQTGMEFAVMQKQPQGLEVVYPDAIATAKPIYPIPPFAKR
jgi:branched-chain amino acid transport system substrate-binding protein